MRLNHEDQCPRCHHMLDAATGVDGKAGPRPNDFSICLYCACVLIFKDDLRVRVAQENEITPLMRTYAAISRQFIEEKERKRESKRD